MQRKKVQHSRLGSGSRTRTWSVGKQHHSLGFMPEGVEVATTRTP